MPELTLHFEASEGTDLEAAAAALQKELAAVPAVESVETTPQRFQAIGPAEVLGVIQVTTSVVQSSAALLTAVAGLCAAWEKLKPYFPGLKRPTVEVGLRQVPATEFTEKDGKELASS